MKGHLIFIVAAVAIAWIAMLLGVAGVFWVRVLGALLGFFGFLFVFMLSDQIGDSIRFFGIDLIIIAVGLLVIWL